MLDDDICYEEDDESSPPAAAKTLSCLDLMKQSQRSTIQSEPILPNVLLFAEQANEQQSEKRITELAIKSLTKAPPPLERQPRSCCTEIATDAAAVAAGLTVKYGLNRAIPKTTAPGLVVGFICAGSMKAGLCDDGYMERTDFLRGGMMFGLSNLVIKGMMLNPSRSTLSAETNAALSRQLGIDLSVSSSAALSEKVISAGAGGSVASRTIQFLNPLCYTGLRMDGLRLSYVGFGGENTAKMLADGSISFAEFNARRAIGSVGNSFGTAYAIGAGRESVYQLSAGRGDPHHSSDLHSAASRINSVGLAAGISSGLKDFLQNIALRLRK